MVYYEINISYLYGLVICTTYIQSVNIRYIDLLTCSDCFNSVIYGTYMPRPYLLRNLVMFISNQHRDCSAMHYPSPKNSVLYFLLYFFNSMWQFIYSIENQSKANCNLRHKHVQSPLITWFQTYTY